MFLFFFVQGSSLFLVGKLIRLLFAWSTLYCVRQHPSSVKHLLQLGANPNLANQHGHTALHIACAKGYMSEAQVLIANGKNIDVNLKVGNWVKMLCCLIDELRPDTGREKRRNSFLLVLLALMLVCLVCIRTRVGALLFM